jgi:hypothetical protein
LWAALAVCIVITALYLGVAQNGVPRSSGLFGHTIGIVGFVLMLAAEVLYTWRKQTRRHVWGRTRWWLEMHVFVGLVGPYMVLLHSAWRLNGVAGAAMLLTILMVATGFLTRYIYTAVPRTVDGVEMAKREVNVQLAAVDAQVEGWRTDNPQAVSAMGQRLAALSAPMPGSDTLTVLTHSLLHWNYLRQLRAELRRLDASQEETRALGQLLERRYELQMQMNTLATTRRMLSLFRAAHVVVGVVLFVLAFFHIGAALYYATFAR